MCGPSVFNLGLPLKQRALPSVANSTNLVNYQLEDAFLKLDVIQLIIL